MTALSLLLLYSLYLSAGLSIMYGAIRLSKTDMMLHGRRMILLSIAAVVVAAGIPLLSGWLTRPEVSVEALNGAFAALPVDGAAMNVDTDTQLKVSLPGIMTVVSVVYAIGLLFCLGRMAMVTGRICLMIRRAEQMANLCIHDDSIVGPFSWGGRIFISREDYESDGDILMTHENAHSDAGHWKDLLFINLLGCLTWYCPAARALRRTLQSVHEFEADRAVLDAGFDARSYQMLLIGKATGRSIAFSVADCLNNPPLKTRILMMQSTERQSKSRVRALALIPVSIVICAVASIPALGSNAAMLMPLKVVSPIPSPAGSEDYIIPETVVSIHDPEGATTDSIATENGMEKVFEVVEQQPEFPGGQAALMQFIGSNLRYPEECHARKITGRSVVQFVVKADGSIGDVSVLRSADPQLDGEAVRLVRSLPAFEPGKINGQPVNVRFTLPVVFKISSGECSVVPKKESKAE